ncbi:MAG: hypothetical protein GWM90_07675 [Gemmatimonadetes bacterium]|nr:hypothetical protein [Gemmatimonadota bacterium]NIQ54140.1 hypothetical protein [Gemmatimonadota bacterium]NIU74339.1 hypothetical protein [Gammaproteobacteria bacterium]NIX43991.1 hypothetical protein [Gemmatimonadota bacterium]NIY08564.1 hypothetical protein [Gemmatimonadota bacterium]
MRRYLVLWAVLLPACGDDGAGVPRDAPPAAAVVAPGGEAATLDQQLADLESELERALAGEPDHLVPAEAITDRLMQASRPVDWLALGYDVEARLRQLQAMADRVVAMLRRGASLPSVRDDIETMRVAAADLRAQLSQPGGGAAPPPLDSLLAQDPLRDVQARSLEGVTAADTSDPMPEPLVGAVQSGPLGRPVPAARDTSPDVR